MRLSLRAPSGLKTLNMQSLSMARKATPTQDAITLSVNKLIDIEDDRHMSSVGKGMELFLAPGPHRTWNVFVPDRHIYYKYNIDTIQLVDILRKCDISDVGPKTDVRDFSHFPISHMDNLTKAFETKIEAARIKAEKKAKRVKREKLNEAQFQERERVRELKKAKDSAARKAKREIEIQARRDVAEAQRIEDRIYKDQMNLAQHINMQRNGQDRYPGTPLDRNPSSRNPITRVALDHSGQSLFPDRNLVRVKHSNGKPGKVVHYNDVNGIYITNAVDLIGSLVRPLRWSNGDWGTTKITKYITRKAGKTVFSRASKDKRLLINLNRIRVDSQFMGFKLVDVSDTGYRLVHPKARISVRVYLEKEVVTGSRLKIEVLGADSEVAKVSTVDLNQ